MTMTAEWHSETARMWVEQVDEACVLPMAEQMRRMQAVMQPQDARASRKLTTPKSTPCSPHHGDRSKCSGCRAAGGQQRGGGFMEEGLDLTELQGVSLVTRPVCADAPATLPGHTPSTSGPQPGRLRGAPRHPGRQGPRGRHKL